MSPSFLAVLLAVLLLSGCAAPAPAPPDAPEPPPEQTSLPDAPPLPEPAPEPEPGDFVRVTDYLPEIRVDLRYAGEDNFTGQVIYSFSGAYLRYGTLEKLSAAQETLAEAGYGLLLWDAFRPTAAQFRLWEVCPDPAYVANPQRGFSSHSRGNTVDLTLVTLEGETVEMPTGFDDFSPLADRDYSDVPETAAANARLLESAMTAAGFRPYQGEWWHFTDTDDYPVEEDFSPEQQEEPHADYGH
ncbi:MAG: M15 family metallopeptidase [Oscillibacter sp.]|nr:M15 family metallopeptidase [Oscillibacter sp.]